ncbi:MAG: metallophosphoesterase [Candidatus Cryptobacteroides sp.]
MYSESIAVISVLLLCWAVLVLLDLPVSWAVSAWFGIRMKKCFLWGLLSLILPVVLMLYGVLIGRNSIQVNELDIPCDNLPKSFEGYRIVHISDIHARSFENRERVLERIIERINAQNPDMVAFTGDLITISPNELEGLLPLLGRIQASDGVFSVLGNHDYCTFLNSEARDSSVRKLVEAEREIGWELLLNEHRVISRGTDSIAVVGVENTSTFSKFVSRGDLDRAVSGTDGLFKVLLSHDPTHWEAQVLDNDIPLTLSGHTHAIQMSFFGWCPSKYFFRQYRGLYEQDGKYLYVNIGLGETIFPARIGTDPEITVLTLRNTR